MEQQQNYYNNINNNKQTNRESITNQKVNNNVNKNRVTISTICSSNYKKDDQFDEITRAVYSGQSKNLLSKIAQDLIDDFNEFSKNITETQNTMLESMGADIENYIKVTADEKKKLDVMKYSENEIIEKIKVINSIKEKFNIDVNVEEHLSQ